jgi:hypothetical protein
MHVRGALPNARKSWGGGGPWTIPVIDLVALDILPDLSDLPDEAYPAT